MIVAQTYKDVVNQFRSLCDLHPAVESFRVGPVSMIEIPTQEGPTNSYKYPAVHLVPQPAVLDGRSTQFDFDVVVFDLAKDQLDLEETIHNSTMEILRDLLASYSLTTWQSIDYNIVLPVTATPFVEGYKNSVAGWTAVVQIIAKSPFDNCNNPITLPL